MILKNLQKNKACPQCLKHSFCRRGFVMLFAITISAIILVIALGVVNIAFKEVRFSTDARDTNNAFFAADTGIEQALFNDKAPNIICTVIPPNTSCNLNFIISQLGSTGQSCVIVNVVKSISPVLTTITSTGYNSGGDVPTFCSPIRNSVERELTVTY